MFTNPWDFSQMFEMANAVKLGHLLLFLSLVLPFIKLQNNSPVYPLTGCLLLIEVD